MKKNNFFNHLKQNKRAITLLVLPSCFSLFLARTTLAFNTCSGASVGSACTAPGNKPGACDSNGLCVATSTPINNTLCAWGQQGKPCVTPGGVAGTCDLLDLGSCVPNSTASFIFTPSTGSISSVNMLNDSATALSYTCSIALTNSTKFSFLSATNCPNMNLLPGACDITIKPNPTAVTGDSTQIKITCGTSTITSGTYTYTKTPPTFCAPGWTPYSSTCTPNDISSDYYHDPSDTNGLQSLICGSTNHGSRIPVLSSFEPLPISSSGAPSTNNSAPDPASNLSLKGIRNPPTGTNTQDFTYAYNTLPRCVCMGPDKNSAVAPVTTISQDDTNTYPKHNALSGGSSRIYPDTFDVISTQNQSGSVRYNMVAYSADPGIDGRQGDVFSSGGSICGCPNINEKFVNNPKGISDVGLSGVHCESMVSNTTPGRILTTYDPALHDSSSSVDPAVKTAMGPQIIQPQLDKSVLGSTTDMAQIISIPTNAGGTQQYTRKIWTCAPPYQLSNGTCNPPDMTQHTCGSGVSAGIESPVSATAGSFSKVVNQKLACCMNDIFFPARATAGSFIKFDCIDNSTATYTSFDDLWSKTDQDTAGATYGSSTALNAVVLAGPSNKPLTGFYTLGGARCDQYNEFGAPIKSQKLTKATNGWVADSSGGTTIKAVPDPTSTSNTLIGPPTTASEMYRCPILVRAAMVATCPSNPDLPVVQKTYTDSNGIKYCSSASSIQVHVRIEQIYEIAGMPKMKTIDTIQDQRAVAGVSVDQIIAQKNGGACPAGSIKQGDVCVYN